MKDGDKESEAIKQQTVDSTERSLNKKSGKKSGGLNRKITILVIATLVVLVGVRLTSQKRADSDSRTPQEASNSAPELRDATTGWKYKKIQDSNQVRSLSGVYKGKTNGFLLYERTESANPTPVTLPDACNTFTQDDLLHHDGGMAIIKNILKDNGVKYTTLSELSDQFTSKGIPVSMITIDDMEVLRIDDPGNGLTQSCKTDKDKIENNLDFKTTYVTLTKAGDEIFVALVQPYIANNGTVLDAEATAKATNIFSEEDLKSQVSYLLANN